MREISSTLWAIINDAMYMGRVSELPDWMRPYIIYVYNFKTNSNRGV